MNFRAEYITANIVHLTFNDSALMCRTMVRFAEHFESPKFRGRVFTWRVFRKWYSWDKGSFSYDNDWGGFNIPSYVFDAFKNGSFDPLTYGEQDVLAELADQTGKYYVIATAADTEETLRHELGHAFYYMDEAYKAKVDAILAVLPDKDIPKSGIEALGYHPEVLHDELHAYLIDGMSYLNELTEFYDDFGWYDLFKYWRASRKLNKLLDATLKATEASI